MIIMSGRNANTGQCFQICHLRLFVILKRRIYTVSFGLAGRGSNTKLANLFHSRICIILATKMLLVESSHEREKKSGSDGKKGVGCGEV